MRYRNGLPPNKVAMSITYRGLARKFNKPVDHFYLWAVE